MDIKIISMKDAGNKSTNIRYSWWNPLLWHLKAFSQDMSCSSISSRTAAVNTVSFVARIYSVGDVYYHETWEAWRCEKKCTSEVVSGWKITLIGNFHRPSLRWHVISVHHRCPSNIHANAEPDARSYTGIIQRQRITEGNSNLAANTPSQYIFIMCQTKGMLWRGSAIT